MDKTIACDTCGLVQRVEELRPRTAAECLRCGSILAKRKVDSLGRTAAFSLAALIFYVPANIYPILRMDYYGAYSESTVWDGPVRGGTAFPLHDKPKQEWLEWAPKIPIPPESP